MKMRNSIVILTLAGSLLGCTVEGPTFPEVNWKGGGIPVHRVDDVWLNGPANMAGGEVTCWGQGTTKCTQGHSATSKVLFVDYFWKDDERFTWAESPKVLCVEPPSNPGLVRFVLSARCTAGAFGAREIHMRVGG